MHDAQSRQLEARAKRRRVRCALAKLWRQSDSVSEFWLRASAAAEDIDWRDKLAVKLTAFQHEYPIAFWLLQGVVLAVHIVLLSMLLELGVSGEVRVLATVFTCVSAVAVPLSCLSMVDDWEDLTE